MGGCQYRYNASEQYQRQVPGAGVETHCGGRTYAICDEPEMVPFTVRDDDGSVHTEYQHTGNYLPRAHDDPHCPAHGGTPEPPPPVLTWHQIQERAEALEVERRGFVAELQRANVPIPDALTVAPALQPAPVTAEHEMDDA